MRAKKISIFALILISGAWGGISIRSASIHSPPLEVKQTSPAAAKQEFISPFFSVSEQTTQSSTLRSLEDSLPLVATVNNQPVLRYTYQRQVSRMEQALQAQGVDLNSEPGREMLTRVRRQVLEAMIDQLLIEQEANRLNLRITDEELAVRVQANLAQAQSPADFEDWLAANQLTYTEFENIVQSQLIANQVFEQITATVPARAHQIQLRHIRVMDQATAQAIIVQLKQGVDFVALAQQESLDEIDEAHESQLAWFPQGMGQLPPEVEMLAFSLQPGQVSGPIQTGLGFYIIKLENSQMDRLLTREIIQSLKERLFTNWLKEQRLSATIKEFGPL